MSRLVRQCCIIKAPALGLALPDNLHEDAMLRAIFAWRPAAMAAALGLAIGTAAMPAGAATIHLDVDAAELAGMSGVLTARDRLARAGSVDQMLFVGSPGGPGGARDNLGYAAPYAGSVTYDFRLTYTAVDSTYTFGLTDGAVTGNVSFRPGGASNTITFAGSPLSYNILHVFAASTADGSSVTFSELFFTPGAGLSTAGTLETAGATSAAGTATYDQWLAAGTGTNLAAFDWTMGARVTLTAGSTASRPADEAIKFEITAKIGEYAPPPPVVGVPEPMALALFGLGLAALGVARRRG
jgi:hypothetical protein